MPVVKKCPCCKTKLAMWFDLENGSNLVEASKLKNHEELV